MHTIYQAGPLFSQAEKKWHQALTLRLERAGHTVIWPGALLTDEDIREAGPQAPARIYHGCRKALERCTCVVALLDGAQVDDGTAWEIGYAVARGLPVFGLRTDGRQAGDTPYSRVNSMIEQSLTALVCGQEELLPLLEAEAGEAEPQP